ncbi:ATP synthase F1 subunit epsilon [Alicyclobacillus sendaiensis]|uniref:ATP synthase epsilon chain n=1 Tax=Alicyclobacillus sendaiensis PA2 TaxID=3029425 RepID=A0ABT6XUR3_ALISE|nr:ATP synthase F1 subunit epsilon [Alicyclobacillus sendaiensis]MDI9258831.1 ATP synthase F1 subunit epsilon [Alicyclobacillus sendaiensis PA2]
MLTVPLEIVTPERIVLSMDVRMVILRGGDGEIGILPRHMPLATAVKPCLVRIRLADDRQDVVPVSGGFVEVLPEKITILADTAELPEEIDVDRALRAKDRAEKRLQAAADEEEAERARQALTRAELRLQAVEEHKRLNGFLHASAPSA